MRDELTFYLCFFGQSYSIRDWLSKEGILNSSEVDAAIAGSGEAPGRLPGTEGAVAGLVRLAPAYLAFAWEHRLRWQALFDHRMQDAGWLGRYNAQD